MKHMENLLAMSGKDLRDSIVSLRRKMLALRIQRKGGEVKTHVFRQTRRDLARHKTAMKVLQS